MIVVSTVPKHFPAPEELDEFLENIAAGFTLDNCEFRSNLPLQSHLRASIDRATETAFTIDETHNPSWVDESFLLIFRRDS